MSARRLAVAAAVAVVAATSACGSEPRASAPQAMPNNTAVVRIDGHELGEQLYVSCRKQQWLLTIDTVDTGDGGSFTAMVDAAPDHEVGFVKFRDLSGFTGGAWRGGVGEASARREGGVMTIRGTAYGFFADSPRPVNAAFDIRTVC